MSTIDRKREKLKASLRDVDSDIFRTDRDRRAEKKRRKEALSRLDRREAKNELRSDRNEED